MTVWCQPRGSHEARIRSVNSLIDAFAAQPHRRLVGEAQSKMTADLLGAPPLTKQLGDHGTKPTVDLDSAPVVTCPPNGAR